MKNILITVAFLLCSVWVMGQSTIQPRPIGDDFKGFIYNQEVAVNLRGHTNGFAFGVDIGRIKTYYQTKYFHIEIGELKHAKESRQSPDYASSPNGKVSRAFKFGKQNSFYALRAGFGNKRYFSEKAKRKGVAVGISYEGGATLGMIKPYYLELFSPENGGNPVTTRYSEENRERFLDIWQIYGSASWTNGLNELSVIPGVHGKLAVHFDWGAFDEYVKAIEAGIMLDVFSKKVPIMVETENTRNRAYFLNLFVNLQFGKRW